MPIAVVTDNGPAFKSAAFARYIASRPEFTHVRTRHRSPGTNGVIERFFGALKYESTARRSRTGLGSPRLSNATAPFTTPSGHTRRSASAPRSRSGGTSTAARGQSIYAPNCLTFLTRDITL